MEGLLRLLTRTCPSQVRQEPGPSSDHEIITPKGNLFPKPQSRIEY